MKVFILLIISCFLGHCLFLLLSVSNVATGTVEVCMSIYSSWCFIPIIFFKLLERVLSLKQMW